MLLHGDLVQSFVEKIPCLRFLIHSALTCVTVVIVRHINQSIDTNLLVPPSPKQTFANRKMKHFGKCFVIFKYATVIIQTSKQLKPLNSFISTGVTCCLLTSKTWPEYTNQFQELYLAANKYTAVPALAFQRTDCSDWFHVSTSAFAQCFLLVPPSVHPQMQNYLLVENSHVPTLVALMDLTSLQWGSGSLGATALGPCSQLYVTHLLRKPDRLHIQRQLLGYRQLTHSICTSYQPWIRPRVLPPSSRKED